MYLVSILSLLDPKKMALQSSPDGSDPKILSTKKDLAAWDAEIPPFDKDFMFDVVKIERDIQRKSANVYKNHIKYVRICDHL